MAGAEGRALDRSEPGTNVSQVYQPVSKAATSESRRETPPIVESLDETLEEVLAKQAGKRD